MERTETDEDHDVDILEHGVAGMEAVLVVLVRRQQRRSLPIVASEHAQKHQEHHLRTSTPSQITLKDSGGEASELECMAIDDT